MLRELISVFRHSDPLRDVPAGVRAAAVLDARYCKRIGGHPLNVLSGVAMPLHKLDYVDEDELPNNVLEALS